MNDLTLAGVFYTFYLITKLLITVDVYKDSKSLKLKSGLWALIVMLFPNYIGFVFYLIIRTLKIAKTANGEGKNINMKNFKTPILLIISILLLGSAYYFLGNFFNDVSSSKFSSYQDAKTTIEQGWVPANMPSTAKEIYEVHNLDTNIGNGTFKLSESEAKKFISTLNPIKKGEVLKIESIDEKWWNKEEIKKNIENGKLSLGEKDDFVFAINSNGTVYFWNKK
ncbi:hypothetical protein [Faecalimicrobium dakarense]|uniref:hypothetical protein n=1 Tax=Faecalimicrobium dakarense TaxID=1301100 RepID=UPI0004AE7859|nr:hypothetical protein [[Clostridium] dakarense]